MHVRRWSALAVVVASLCLGACGPAEDGGGGAVGASCRTSADCASNGCCGTGTGAVGIGQRPSCPSTCSNGQDPYSPYVNNGSGLVTCDQSFRCTVAVGG